MVENQSEDPDGCLFFVSRRTATVIIDDGGGDGIAHVTS
jgi:hypothetical protein